jgi:hypothetical protein
MSIAIDFALDSEFSIADGEFIFNNTVNPASLSASASTISSAVGPVNATCV